MRKQYIEVPLLINSNTVLKLWHWLTGILMLPCYMIAAKVLRTPGITLQIKCAFLGCRLFLLRRTSLKTCFSLLFFDSTRYFEYNEVLNSLKNVAFSKYLDVSSPRLIPLILLLRNKNAVAEIINPDSRDLQETEQIADALKITDNCSFKNSTIEMTKYEPKTFDLITCISVLEHIPSDREAVDMMWSLLRTGGRFILTLPCMRVPLEQYISRNDYGVLSPESDGYTFWQRFYDEERLREVIYNVTGPPVKSAVYGERRYGFFFRNANLKRLVSLYPFWSESYMMGKEWQNFQNIAELPGEGVIMLEFIKP